jgi:hypothetical protein
MAARRLVTLLLLCASLGCSGEKPRVPVYGRVTLRGYPVRGGVIAFTPDRERGFSGQAASADVGPDGRFRVGNGGLAPGWYRLTVASYDGAVPTRFQDPELANLQREVVAGRENSWDVELQ